MRKTMKQENLRLGAFCSLALLSLLLAACGKDSAASKTITGPADTVKLYRANCVSCHGTELQGKMGPTTNLSAVGARLSEAEITKQIQDGGGSMPAFSQRLTEKEISKLASWLAGHK